MSATHQTGDVGGDPLPSSPGEMAARFRAFNWAATPLGPVAAWPPALRSAVRVMLDAPVAMSLWCGAAYTLLYNDAYRRVLGAKHPAALGQPGAAVWAELWAEIEPQLRQVRAGGAAVAGQDVPFAFARAAGGGTGEARFDYSLSAVRDEGAADAAGAVPGDADTSGAVVAVLSVVTETTARVLDVTDQVRARRAVEAVNAQLQEQQLELELANQQLQEQTIELEAQAEELETTAAQLEERTEEAEAARQRAEAERARAEGILEATADAHFALDAAFRIVAVNGAMARGSGLARADLLGRDFWTMFPGAVGTDFERYYRRASTDGVPAHFTHDYSDGRLELVVEVDAYPTGDGGVAVFWRDITPRVRAEAARERALAGSEAARAALAESEARYRALAEAVPVQVWTARPDGQLDFVNGRAVAYFGVSPDQLLGAGWGAFVHPDDLPDAIARWSHALATGTPYQAEFRLRAGASGAYAWHLARAIPERDATGAVVGWVGSNTDVEGERAARAAAEAANRSKSQFLANMSHELRTPLNAIGGYAQLLELGLHGPVTDDQRTALGRVQRAQHRLLGLINDVLNYAKLEGGRVEYDLGIVDVRTVVTEVAPLIEPQLAAKGLVLDVRLPDGPCEVWTDREKLGQVLVNLLSNAVKFTAARHPVTGAAGRVTIDLATRPDAGPSAVGPTDAVFLRVTDTGRGIPRDKQDAIFEPFVQVRTRDSSYAQATEGTGLGLAISRDLARGMGGDLRVRSQEGEGATFTVTLRRAALEPPGAAEASAANRRGGEE